MLVTFIGTRNVDVLICRDHISDPLFFCIFSGHLCSKAMRRW